jgi:hydrogenase/urease accessory protein HupE
MRTKQSIAWPLAAGTLLSAVPAAVRAHEGYAGEHAWLAGNHGWLAGAAEPLASLDHFLAALFVAVVVAVGVVSAARVGRHREGATGNADR